jgi:hypothetical protein
MWPQVWKRLGAAGLRRILYSSMLIKLILTEAAYIPLKDLPVYDISEHL